jgi:hypothetical protein
VWSHSKAAVSAELACLRVDGNNLKRMRHRRK